MLLGPRPTDAGARALRVARDAAVLAVVPLSCPRCCPVRRCRPARAAAVAVCAADAGPWHCQGRPCCCVVWPPVGVSAVSPGRRRGRPGRGGSRPPVGSARLWSPRAGWASTPRGARRELVTRGRSRSPPRPRRTMRPRAVGPDEPPARCLHRARHAGGLHLLGDWAGFTTACGLAIPSFAPRRNARSWPSAAVDTAKAAQAVAGRPPGRRGSRTCERQLARLGER